jgi:ribosomal protein L11 methyltransferase
VDAFDIDPIAVRASEENLALNRLAIPVRVSVNTGPSEDPWWLEPDGAPRVWDTMLVNILPHIIAALLERGLSRHLAPDGRMILAGIILAREDDVREALTRHRLEVRDRLTQEDWVALVVAK